MPAPPLGERGGGEHRPPCAIHRRRSAARMGLVERGGTHLQCGLDRLEMGACRRQGLSGRRCGACEVDDVVGGGHFAHPFCVGRAAATMSAKLVVESRLSTSWLILAALPEPRTGTISASTLASSSVSVSGLARLPRACGTWATTLSPPASETAIFTSSRAIADDGVS